MTRAVSRGARRFFDTLRNPRSLAAKLVVVLTSAGLVGALAITLLLATVITPSFNQLEATSVDAQVERTRTALGQYASNVELAVRDYGDWTASYAYMANPNAAFERDSFSRRAMTNLDIDGIAYVANDGGIIIARGIDGAPADRADMRRLLSEKVGRFNLARILGARSSQKFYTRLGDMIAAVGVAQVRRSDGTGEPRGYVVMVRRITSARVSALLRLPARVDPAAPTSEIVDRGSTMMTIAVPIPGPDGHAVASARIDVPRDVSVLGRRMLLLAVAGSTGLLLIVLLVLRRMIARVVLGPLKRVETHMQRVRASGSLRLLDEDRRLDEIGSLGRSLNAMLRQLKDLREQLEAQSFALGRSESTVAVMHNVRNALNPISTILSHGMAQKSSLDRAVLDRAIAELGRDDTAPARRAKLAAFVTAAVASAEVARASQRDQLAIGRQAMMQVLEIIGQQQANTHERPPLGVCDVTDIVAQNATIARYSGETSIAFSFPAQPCAVLANRVILSQVIGNLFANATEAISARDHSGGSISVTIEGGDETVLVRIRDNGEGFDPDVGATIFRRGFSTRSHKSGGLGLHWCANSVSAMEGGLRLESEGRGRGAVAVLTLKAAARHEQAQAA